MLRKKVTKIGKLSKVKDKLTFSTKGQNLKYDPAQQVADLQVECRNKDKTIQEYEKHIEQMEDNVRKLDAELQKLCNNRTEIEEQHTKDIETMVNRIFFSN